MGLFDWWGKKRRVEKQLADLEARADELLTELESIKKEYSLTNEMLCSTIAALNVRMQRGQVWATAFNFHVEHLPEPVQVKIREATLRMLHHYFQAGVEVNMKQNPTFDFPTPATESDFPQE